MALELGGTAGGLARALPEREFIDWQRYAARKMLPGRRIEMYLAQIALLIVQVNGGGAGKSISDFMFDTSDAIEQGSDADDGLTADDVAAFFGGTVIRQTET